MSSRTKKLHYSGPNNGKFFTTSAPQSRWGAVLFVYSFICVKRKSAHLKRKKRNTHTHTQKKVYSHALIMFSFLEQKSASKALIMFYFAYFSGQWEGCGSPASPGYATGCHAARCTNNSARPNEYTVLMPSVGKTRVRVRTRVGLEATFQGHGLVLGLAPLRLGLKLGLMGFERTQTRTRTHDFCWMSYCNVLLQSYYISTKYKCDKQCIISGKERFLT